MKKIIIILSLVFPPSIYGQNYYATWGIGFDYPAPHSYSDVQTYALGMRFKTTKTFEYFGELGGWKDPGLYEGARPSFYLAGGLTLNIELKETYLSYSIGPSVISQKDTLLGSNYQVYHKLSIGKHEKDKRLGLFIKHYSNAGALGGSNYGRNFIGMEAGF